MKKTILALAATVGMTMTAVAADLPSRKAAPAFVPPPSLTWTGFYVGANIGGQWDSGNTNGTSAIVSDPVYEVQRRHVELLTPGIGVIGNNTIGTAGITGGVQAGYNYQLSPMFVVGAETDFNGTTLGSGSNGNTAARLAYLNAVSPDINWIGGSAANKLEWFGTVRGRVGVLPLGQALMLYGTGGFAYGQVQRTNGLWANNALQTGWTGGGGVEYKLNQNWSVKGEYLYTQLSGNNSNVFNQGLGVNNVNNKTTFQTVRAGLNYSFNDSLPTLAKY